MTSIANKEGLTRDRWMVGVSMAAVVALCWGWIAPMAVDMYGPMTGWSAWMMTRDWDFTHETLLFAMWTVMMIAMMLPSATPAVLLYAAEARRSTGQERVWPRAMVFAAGYSAVWILFSLAATVLQLALTKTSLLSPMMELRSRWLGGALVLAAGVYQLTPWKRDCLACCKGKMDEANAFRSGVRNGLSCLGCCWALMLLLFVGGVMNLWWIGALTVFVALEKSILNWKHGARLTGGLLVGFAIWILGRGVMG